MPSALCRQSHLHSGFITPWSISSSRLCSSSEVINLDSSPTQQFQSLANFLPYPHPSLNIPFPLPLYSLFWHHHSPSYPGEKSGSHSGHPLTTSNKPWGLLINLSQMRPLFFYSITALVTSITTCALDHWQQVASGLQSPFQSASPTSSCYSQHSTT